LAIGSVALATPSKPPATLDWRSTGADPPNRKSAHRRALATPAPRWTSGGSGVGLGQAGVSASPLRTGQW
jgi:hypothetical protein